MKHHHRWMLERPLRQISHAWCTCGMEADFYNYGPQIRVGDRHQIKAERRVMMPEERETPFSIALALR